MSDSYFNRLDESEDERTSEIIKSSYKAGVLDIRDLFRSKMAHEMLMQENKAHLVSFDENLLPNITLLNNNIFQEICPHCHCVSRPDLLEPYLERGLLLPILVSGYSDYSKEFAELILRYPHISFQEYTNFRTFFLLNKLRPAFCSDCAKSLYESVLSLINSIEEKARKDLLLEYWNGYLYPNLQPFLYPDALVVYEIENALKDKDWE